MTIGSRGQFDRPHLLGRRFTQDLSKLHRDNSSVGPLTTIPPVHLIVTILPSKEAENVIEFLLSEASVSLEKYFSNFNLHPGSLLYVLPPIRILMSQKEQLPILESEPELDRSKQAGPSALGSQVEVGCLFQNNLTSSQYDSRRTNSASDPSL